MPALRLYKTLWGFTGGLERAISEAGEDGFDGLEGPAPTGLTDCRLWRQSVKAAGLDWIAEICTTGSYVADRRASLADHLDDFRQQVSLAAEAGARFVTCLGGCDAWPTDKSVSFYGQAMELAQQAGLIVSFETHRGRPMFSPWAAVAIIEQLPDMLVTADFSHWCVVCERLLDTEEEELAQVIPRVFHVHARVGYAQGPQVPHPAARPWQAALDRHRRWWEAIWLAGHDKGQTVMTMTPEFGPDDYLHHHPFTDEPVADLREVNRWMAEKEREHFAGFMGEELAS